jgi:hypothetical protein
MEPRVTMTDTLPVEPTFVSVTTTTVPVREPPP